MTQERELEVDRERVLYGMDLGMTAIEADNEADEEVGVSSTRKVPAKSRVSQPHYTLPYLLF